MVTRPGSERDVSDVVMVFTTVACATDARQLVRELVAAGLVACGTIIPGAISIYRWKSEISEEPEVMVVLKTARARWAELRSYVEKHHPYDVPELVSVPVESGLPDYLDWVTKETLHRESQRK